MASHTLQGQWQKYFFEELTCRCCAAEEVKLITARKAARGKKPKGKPGGGKTKIASQIAIILTALLLLFIGMVTEAELHKTSFFWVEYIIFLSSYLLVGRRVILTALRNISRGVIFDENFLMTVSTTGAIFIHQLPEAVGVMLFYYIGELFQDMAVDRSRRSIKELMDIRPDYANLKINGEIRTVSPEEVVVGDLIVIKPGEKIPLDGKVVEGSSFLDASALTGESLPQKAEPGDSVLAGMVNTSGVLTVKVSKPFGESSVAKILELVENTSSRKASTEKFITKFSRYYTPAVVFAALSLAIIPPLLLPGADFKDWIYRALILLVISCPCALVLSIPLGYFGGIGGASSKGILVKGANFLEALTNLDAVAFDKTGTLTRGVFKVSGVKPYNGFSEEKLLYYAAAAEYYSNHPIAQSILEKYSEVRGNPIRESSIKDYEEIPGYGVMAAVNGRTVLAGNDRLLHRENIAHDACGIPGTVVYVVVDKIFAGYITISDEIKEDAFTAVKRLKELGVKKIVLLTGDDKTTAAEVASRLEIHEYYANLLPQDKVAKVEELITAKNGRRSGKIAFVGDGINDAPVIARADIGVAMGGLGSDAAIEAADVVLMGDLPSKLAAAVEIARYTKKIVLQNIALALGIKAVFIFLGASGNATLWEAVFADVGVTLIAILNAARALRYSANTKMFQKFTV